MLISTFTFAVMNVIVKYLNNFPTSEIILFRSVVSLLISYYFIRKNKLNPFGNNKALLITRGVFGIIALGLFFFTLKNIPLSTALTIQYISPIFTAIIGIFFLGEKMPVLRWMFFGISFVGIGVVKGFSSDISWIYLISGTLSAFFAGFNYNIIRKLKDTDNHHVIIFYFPLIATPVMAVWSYFEWVQPNLQEWALLISVGILTQIAQVNMTKSLGLLEANVAAIMKYLGIVYALFFDFIIFGVSYSYFVLFGISLVILGVILNVSFNRIKTFVSKY